MSTNKVFEYKTPIRVNVEFCGDIPNAEIITYVIKKKKLFGGFNYKIYQIIPYITNPDINQRLKYNKLLKSTAKRDYGIAEMYIREKF